MSQRELVFCYVLLVKLAPVASEMPAQKSNRTLPVPFKRLDYARSGNGLTERKLRAGDPFARYHLQELAGCEYWVVLDDCTLLGCKQLQVGAVESCIQVIIASNTECTIDCCKNHEQSNGLVLTAVLCGTIAWHPKLRSFAGTLSRTVTIASTLERNTTMEYELPEDLKMLRQAIREFAEKEVAPIAREIDEQERVPFETLKKAGELGLLGVPFPEQYGGADAGIVGYCVPILRL